ncbi:hypothetical protein KP79_PYT26190 [Mizuhopecten yessoensis]|uniref:Uncharacterized protein n=1 Tax=Mizuhopecten yessoensis TaxID=6573 RepID=A0A210QEW1_MIZYE|nr:hypothetical protein KP79_PYT26190 [Mizuhopecten yessoensis]
MLVFFFQSEYGDFALLSNLHLLRNSRNNLLAHGRPILMYTSPELYDTQDYVYPAGNQYAGASKEECTFKNGIPCDPDVYQLCLEIMLENGWNVPNDATCARELYIRLRREVLTLV